MARRFVTSRSGSHGETHRSGRAPWLRAAVLGSDDAVVSTASLLIGVVASSATKSAALIAGVAGLVAGSMSMAVGEYVSVSSQRDAERADIERERRELGGQPHAELSELALIYERRGVERELAMKVAEQLSARDRLGAHLRDELGLDPTTLARPLQAACISAASFAVFSVIPIAALMAAPAALRILAIAALSLVSLAVLGALGGHFGGASIGRASLRVTLGGVLAMTVTAAIGRLIGDLLGGAKVDFLVNNYEREPRCQTMSPCGSTTKKLEFFTFSQTKSMKRPSWCPCVRFITNTRKTPERARSTPRR
jgi:vacuolar iron transporter family protein